MQNTSTNHIGHQASHEQPLSEDTSSLSSFEEEYIDDSETYTEGRIFRAPPINFHDD